MSQGRAPSTFIVTQPCQNTPYRELIVTIIPHRRKGQARCSDRSARKQWRFCTVLQRRICCSLPTEARHAAGFVCPFAADSLQKQQTLDAHRWDRRSCRNLPRLYSACISGGTASSQERPPPPNAVCCICCFSGAGISEFQSFAPDLFRAHPRGRGPAPTLARLRAISDCEMIWNAI